MSKRTSKYGVMYDDKQSKANLDKIVYNIKAEVEFNILTGDVLPFKLNEKLPTNLKLCELEYIRLQLLSAGIVVDNMEVVELL
jgi:hypothetical protein